MAVAKLELTPSMPIFAKMDVKAAKTNADSLIGKEVIVIEEIDNDKETGTVKASGTVWSVRNTEEGVIPSGTKVIIEKIEGVKLFVKKAE